MGDDGSSLVLRGEDVAGAPTDLGVEGYEVWIRMAIWMVMCRDPVMRAPERGWDGLNSKRQYTSPDISTSTSSISRQPKSVWDMFHTLYSWLEEVLDTAKTISVEREDWKSIDQLQTEEYSNTMENASFWSVLNFQFQS